MSRRRRDWGGTSTSRTRSIHILKHTLYALLLLALYVLQTVPGLFVLFGVKPVLVVSAAVAIAMVEGELVGGIYGAAAGLLCDMGGTALFGFNAFFVCICCVLAGLLVVHLLYNNVWCCLLFVLVTMLVCRSIEFLFAFGIWGYEGAWKVYAFQELPLTLYSVVVAPIPYLLARKIHRRFAQLLRD